jgi:hypothetical protein
MGYDAHVLATDDDRVKTTRRKASSSRSKSKHGKASSRDRESDGDSERSVSVAKVRKSVRHRSESASQEDDSEPQPKPVVVRRARGQQGIDGGRAREIQEALIREHYLDGEATGVWDSRSRQAMMRFQNDNGWQTRIIPDSRALIKLGLGPKHSGLLNPESVSDSIPDTAREMRPGGSTPR